MSKLARKNESKALADFDRVNTAMLTYGGVGALVGIMVGFGIASQACTAGVPGGYLCGSRGGGSGWMTVMMGVFGVAGAVYARSKFE